MSFYKTNKELFDDQKAPTLPIPDGITPEEYTWYLDSEKGHILSFMERNKLGPDDPKVLDFAKDVRDHYMDVFSQQREASAPRKDTDDAL